METKTVESAPGNGADDLYDVLIIGAGLAGLCLARQLLLAEPGIRILALDRRAEVPTPRQKVGEATVQASGYYYSRVLDLEEYLLQEHYLKYNLRFYWPSGRGAERYEDLSQSYIRKLSNINTYQLDRNTFEAEVLRRNRECPSYEIHAPASGLDVTLAEEGPHSFRFQSGDRLIEGRARWVVDSSGRGRFLAKKLDIGRRSPIRHGSFFFWVEGLVDPERLTELSPREMRLHPNRSALGHTPVFLATNHFCGEGYWFWTIPLHGKTSLGLVYDADLISSKDVSSPEKVIDWLEERYPMFAKDLRGRKVVDQSGLTDFALDSGQTLSASGWAMVGEACRFTDPLYSPGGDLISIYNTVIADAILTRDRQALVSKVRMYESLTRAVYDAYVPSYAVSYNTLGDQEAFSLRYVWELTVYFGFYVFPFINDLFTDPTFLPGYLRRFSKLGPINQGIHRLLRGFFKWKQENPAPQPADPVFFEFTEVGALASSELCFYKVGLGSEEARKVLDEQLHNLQDLARWTYAHVASVVLGDERVASHPDFIRGIDLEKLEFDVPQMRERWALCPPAEESYAWAFPVPAPGRFRGPMPMQPKVEMPMAVAESR